MTAVYREACTRLGCKENSSFIRVLEAQPNPRTLDLSNNYCGSEHGLEAILEVIKGESSLKEVNLSGNYLTTENVRSLVGVLLKHPTVTTVRLNDNRLYIESGKELVRLARFNPRITTIETEGGNFPVGHAFKNKIPVKIVEMMQRQIQFNLSTLTLAAAPSSPPM